MMPNHIRVWYMSRLFEFHWVKFFRYERYCYTISAVDIVITVEVIFGSLRRLLIGLWRVLDLKFLEIFLTQGQKYYFYVK